MVTLSTSSLFVQGNPPWHLQGKTKSDIEKKKTQFRQDFYQVLLNILLRQSHVFHLGLGIWDQSSLMVSQIMLCSTGQIHWKQRGRKCERAFPQHRRGDHSTRPGAYTVCCSVINIADRDWTHKADMALNYMTVHWQTSKLTLKVLPLVNIISEPPIV